MTEQAPPWPKQGPPSYFPSIEKQWQQVIASCGLDKHTAIVGYLKSATACACGFSYEDVTDRVFSGCKKSKMIY
jgi:hypothetical protein